MTSCSAYTPFSILGPGQSQTGCEVFQLALAATPVELKISGKASADWTIAASAIQPPGAAIGAAPTPAVPPAVTPTSAPAPQAVGTTPSTTARAPNTGGGGTPGAAPTGGTGTGAATAPTTAPTPKSHKSHASGSGKAPKILRVIPRGGYVGSMAQIYGKRLTGVTAVTFNGVPATIVKSLPGRIEVVVPTGATTGSVVVFTTTGTVTSPRTYVVL